MTIYLLYALLPLIIFPLTGTILIQVSRKLWSSLTSFIRQICLLLVWLPLIFFDPEFFKLSRQYLPEILLSGLFWSTYLLSVFKSADHIEMIQWRVINVVARVLFSLIIWILIIGEVVNLYEVIGITIILVWISLYLKIHNENSLKNYNLSLWVAISIIWWFLFVSSQYYFSIYAKAFEPLSSAYLLELSSIPFLFIMILLFQWKKEFSKMKKLSSDDIKKIFLWSAPVLIWSYWLAQSYIHLDFILVNILFCATLIMAWIFGYLILWEKLTKLQIVIFSFILIWLFIVNYF